MSSTVTPDPWVVEILGQHVAEFRRDTTVGHQRWLCTCGTWRGDHYTDWHQHLAEMLEPRIQRRALAVVDAVAIAIETERDNKDRVWNEPVRGTGMFRAGMTTAVEAIREAVREKR